MFRFGGFDFDPDCGELRKDGRRVRLRPQPAALLTHLAHHAGAFVSRTDLRRTLWPDGTFVRFDLGLNSCVKQIRRALGDDRRRPRFLETLPRRGYRFIAPVELAGSRDEQPDTLLRLTLCPFAVTAPEGLDATTRGIAETVSDDLAASIATDAQPRVRIVAPPPNGRHAGWQADFVLGGAVRRVGDAVRLSVHLADITDGAYVWARIYDTPGENPLAAARALARSATRDLLSHLRLESAAEAEHAETVQRRDR